MEALSWSDDGEMMIGRGYSLIRELTNQGNYKMYKGHDGKRNNG